MGNNKKYVVDANFIKVSYELKLSLVEFLLLLYFDNADNLVFDLDIISQKLKIEKNAILEAFNNLISKNMVAIKSEKNASGKRDDKVTLDGFYDKVLEAKNREKKGKIKDNIFTKFESEFKRPLNGIEFEIIKAWMEKMYSEELILKALEEAKFNGVLSVRYIDTILYEWHRKGIKSKEDVDEYFKNRYETKKLEDTNILEFNWLDDYDK